jgi:hypothetical protein
MFERFSRRRWFQGLFGALLGGLGARSAQAASSGQDSSSAAGPNPHNPVAGTEPQGAVRMEFCEYGPDPDNLDIFTHYDSRTEILTVRMPDGSETSKHIPRNEWPSFRA